MYLKISFRPVATWPHVTCITVSWIKKFHFVQSDKIFFHEIFLLVILHTANIIMARNDMNENIILTSKFLTLTNFVSEINANYSNCYDTCLYIESQVSSGFLCQFQCLHCVWMWNLHQRVYFHKCYAMTLSFIYRNYPTCFEKVFFRKISLRGLQWYIFPLVYPLWCWRNKFSDRNTTLRWYNVKFGKVMHLSMAAPTPPPPGWMGK